MKPYLADFHLASTHLHLAQKQTEKANSHLTQSKNLIEERGYRRDKEVEELEEN